MLAVILCLSGVAALLLLAEVLWRKNLLKGEDQRKFLHISAGTFIAFWPWIVSWQAIQVMGLAMLAVVVLSRFRREKLHFLHDKKRESYGDIYFALAVIVCAFLTDQNIFFALAILHLALADGFAAVVGKRYGQEMAYKVFHQTKTLLGSMTFWMISLSLLGGGLVFAYDSIPFVNYAAVLVILPPVLTLIENITGFGLDNIVIPIAVIAGLQIAVAS